MSSRLDCTAELFQYGLGGSWNEAATAVRELSGPMRGEGDPEADATRGLRAAESAAARLLDVSEWLRECVGPDAGDAGSDLDGIVPSAIAHSCVADVWRWIDVAVVGPAGPCGGAVSDVDLRCGCPSSR